MNLKPMALVAAWWVVSNLRNLLATASLAAIAAGFWMAWPPLGLIVPGSIVFALLVWSHIRSQEVPPDA